MVLVHNEAVQLYNWLFEPFIRLVPIWSSTDAQWSSEGYLQD